MAKFPGCGDLIPTGQMVITESGSSIPFFITGADPDIGGTASQIVNMAVEATDYVSAGLDADGTFSIIIETAAPIVVQLAGGDDLTITQAQVDAYLGTAYPAKIKTVYKVGTTGTFTAVR